MPDMDGNTLARHIRTSYNPDMPIIGISGTSWLLEENNFDLVFQKPFSIKKFIDAIQTVVDGRMYN
jgi:CheY-like chemotaxis protein